MSPTRFSSGGCSVHFSNACGQRGRNLQPCGRLISDGGAPANRREPLRLRAVEPRDRAEQAPGVRVLRVVEELALRPVLDDAARVHHGDVVGDVGDDAEVVRDQDHRRVEVVLELVDQLDDLRLDRHVERRRGLVGDQDVRVVRQRHRDHRALAHAARELMRIVVDALFRMRDPDLPQELHGAVVARGPLVDVLVRADRLADLLPRPCRRGSSPSSDPGRSSRISLPRKRRSWASLIFSRSSPLYSMLALELRVHAAREPEQRHRRDALARAGLPHDAENLAALELERDAVDCADDRRPRSRTGRADRRPREASRPSRWVGSAGRGTRRRSRRSR